MWGSDYKALQGNIGLGRAIAYFTSIGASVLLPLNDTQKYDLCVDDGLNIKRISVKTVSYKSKGTYQVQLRNTGGSSGKSTVRKFDNKSSDYLFILTEDGTMLLIPTSEIDTQNTYNLTPDRVERYKVIFGR